MDQPSDLDLVRPSSEPPHIIPPPIQTADMMPVPFQTAPRRNGMNERLYVASSCGNKELLKQLLEEKLDVLHEVTPAENTTLHVASYFGHQGFVEELLQLSQQDAEAGNHEFVRAKNIEGNTALHEAAVGGHYNVVDVLLRYEPDLVCATNFAGETALFRAAEEGHASIVARLLACTPDQYDRRNLDGQTLLHRAVFNRHKDVVEKILEHRSGLLQQKDCNGWTPLHVAAFFPVPIARTLAFLQPKQVKDIREIGKMLIRKDSSLCYEVNSAGQSPLHVAVVKGNASLVEEILKCRVDCRHLVDAFRRSALQFAVANASRIFDEVNVDLRYIICSVMDRRFINWTDTDGRTALDLTIQCANLDPQLYTAIHNFLASNGARSSIHMLTLESNTMLTAKSIWKPEMISINAVLVATVAFTVAFTLPRVQESDAKKGALSNLSIFKVLVLFDAVAFFYSIAAAVLLIFALSNSQAEDPLISKIILGALWVAVVSIGMTFGAAIHLVVAPISTWLAVVVWAMAFSLPLWILLMTNRGKLFLFTDPTQYILFLIRQSIIIMDTLCSPVLVMVKVFITFPALLYSRAKKMLRRKGRTE